MNAPDLLIYLFLKVDFFCGILSCIHFCNLCSTNNDDLFSAYHMWNKLDLLPCAFVSVKFPVQPLRAYFSPAPSLILCVRDFFEILWSVVVLVFIFVVELLPRPPTIVHIENDMVIF